MQFFVLTNPHLYISVFLALINAFVLTMLSYKFLQVIQQGGYSVKSYVNWLKNTQFKHALKLLFVALVSLFCALVVNSLLDVYNNKLVWAPYMGLVFYFAFCFILLANMFKKGSKVPLVKTKRMFRWLSVVFTLYLVFSFLVLAFCAHHFLLLKAAMITVTPIFVPFVVVCAFYLVLPVELLINKKFMLKAQKKLKQLPHLKIVAITGSYAKTSNKFILQQMLSKKYNTLASPKSFNTPMGLTKTVLQHLTSQHQFFVAEFGANKVKDIKQLCNFIKPHYGIITGVGNQHLQTFKSLENIAKTKFELAEYLQGNLVVFNGDNQINLEYYNTYSNPNKLITYKDNAKGFAYCKNIKTSHEGTQFTLVLNGKPVDCSTKLLGTHNLENFAMCAAVAHKLGVTHAQIAQAISELKPVKHRLEIVSQSQDYVVIDDSFNASVQGTKAALDTFNLFKQYTKIIVTPGIVEAGQLGQEVNQEFGKNIAKVCDYAIIVNQINKPALSQGLRLGGMKNCCVFFVDDLQQAQEKIATLRTEKTAVLFENDLPDLFAY